MSQKKIRKKGQPKTRGEIIYEEIGAMLNKWAREDAGLIELTVRKLSDREFNEWMKDLFQQEKQRRKELGKIKKQFL